MLKIKQIVECINPKCTEYGWEVGNSIFNSPKCFKCGESRLCHVNCGYLKLSPFYTISLWWKGE